MAAFNWGDPGFLDNPYPFYAMGRTASPLFVPGRELWLVFGYHDVQAVLKDNETWSSQMMPPGYDGPPPTMLQSDPPRHTRLRGLVSQAFTPRVVEQLEPRIREIATALVDAVSPAREADLVEALTYPLPVIVIAEILGIPGEDREQFKRWSNDVVDSLGTGLAGEQRGQAIETVEAMRVYFGELIEERRIHPRNDLISGLVAAEVDGQRLDPVDLLQMLILLLVAGNETTTNLIGNAIIEFMAHPAELAKVRQQPGLLPDAIEEVLRHSSPVQATVRRATRETEIGGKKIAAGQAVVLWLGSANRDPEVFAEPDTFDVTRAPNRHLSFGHGIHFCLGAPLARLEARVALEVFLARFARFERPDAETLPRVPTFIMRGVRRLPVRLTPAAAAARP